MSLRTETPTPQRPPARPAAPAPLGSVAIVHDYLNQPGGAERVVLEMAEMWRGAPIYTSLYRPSSTFPDFVAHDIRTSPLDRLPVDRAFRNLFPLYPAAFRALGVLDHDVVVSSSSGWAHSVRTAPRTFHAVYCHTPARWLYGDAHLGSARRQQALTPLRGAIRGWDRRAARRADLYIANSEGIRERIRARYGLDAPVVYPPVDVERFRPRPRGERLLIVSRLLPYKRVDVVVEAATRAGIGLDVVGTGPALDELRRLAGPTVTFHGRLPDADVTELMQTCRAFCLPGKEDFGLTPVEAQAAGKPVVAFAGGGALETVTEGLSGSFFTAHDPDDVLAAIHRCDDIATSPARLADGARRFSREAFRTNLERALRDGLDARADDREGRPRRGAPTTPPRPFMLGLGWFPDQPGGLDRYYRDLLTELPEACGLVLGPQPAGNDRVAGVCDVAAPLPRRLRAFWAATQESADRADVVDVHFALYALAPLWLGRLRRKPVVLHFHGPWADENVAAGDGSAVRLQLRRGLERLAYRRAAHAVVLTSAFRQVLVERYGVQPWDISVVPPGVDLQRFAPGDRAAARAALGLEPGAFVAAAVRRLVPRMGLTVLLEAWAGVVDGLPAGSTLLIAGDGPQRAELVQRIHELGLDGTARLLGRITDDELVDLYRAADVAVVPTLEHEGFGLVVTEAAACGTPSVVTAVGGLPEAIAGLDRSLIVPPGDVPALGERLLRAPQDLPDRARARAHAERFAWPAVAQRHRRIYRRAVAGSRSDDRLKVVYLDHVARLSGGEIALLRLLPHLDRVQPHVILAEDGPLVGELHLAGISTEVMPLADGARALRKAQVQGLPLAAASMTGAYVLRLARRLRALEPDLVHANSLKSGVYGCLAARLAGVPMVWHVRDRIAEDYLPAPAVRLVRGMSRRFPAAVIANSQATLQTLEPHGEAVVLYPVLPEVMGEHVAARPPAGEAQTFGIVGRLAPWKGQDVFLRAFARAFPGGDRRAVIVGSALFGEDDYERRLTALATSLGIAERVEFRGFRSDVFAELAEIDVLVHASITPEPFGQVILEGMAADVPVIATRGGGPAEILDDDVSGVLYEPGDVDELARAMRRMDDPALRTRLTAAARGSLERYRPDIVAAQLQDVYRTLLR